MKNIFILFLCTLINTHTSNSQDEDCFDQIRTGIFTYMAEGALVTVVRTETKQIESFNNGKSKVITKIKWIGQNEYLLTFLRQKKAKGCLKRGDDMKVTIIECNGWVYTARLSTKHCGGTTFTTTFTKIK